MQTTHTHYRTHTCGDLRMEHVGQTVTLAGFLENVREVGQNFAFAVLRDFYGVTQVVVENEAMWKAFKGLNKMCIRDSNRAARCISILGGRLLPSVDYVIPGANVRHRVVLVEKCTPTPNGYPRRWAKIQKAPL